MTFIDVLYIFVIYKSTYNYYTMDMFSRKTKIVCSMGPSSSTDEIVEKLLSAGMNVARFNFSHGSHESHKEAMERVRRASKKLQKPVALLLDTKGPEIRTGLVPNDGKITITKGDKVEVTVDDRPVTEATETESAHVSVNWKDLVTRATPGIKILIADGLVELEVQEVRDNVVHCIALNTGSFGSRKNVNIIGLHAGLPIMSEQDKADIAFGAKMNVDFIAASFVSFAHEVQEIRNYLTELGSKAKIIAKIENEEGLNNIVEIIQAADGVMVARGDLGVQLATEKIPLAQKHIINECRRAGKPVITATQMLDSMIVNPRPTRAELTDVANAIFDGTDAVMLSGETANGSYPVEAVETMARIAITVEKSEEYKEKMRDSHDDSFMTEKNMGDRMARMAYYTATEMESVAILTPTLSGNTARMISKYRPDQMVIAITTDSTTQRQLMLNWGVVPLLSTVVDDSEQMVQNAIKIALDAGAISVSQRILMVAGIPLSSPLMVNTIRVIVVGNVIARGDSGGFNDASRQKVHGRIFKAENVEEAYEVLRRRGGEILVCPTLTQDYLPLLRIVDSVIIEGDSLISDETLSLVNPRLVWIKEARNAFKSLEVGLNVTVDGKELLVYEGTI